MIIKKTLILFVLLTISSCASSLHESTNINEDLKKLSNKDLLAPELPIIKREFKASIAKRALASKSEDKQITNKKLYFSLLYEQYQEMRTYINEQDSKVKAPDINSCPQFHSNVVGFKERIIHDIRDIGIRGKNIKGPRTKRKKYVVENYPIEKRVTLLAAGGELQKGYFPELSLPLSPTKLHPTVQELFMSPKLSHPEKVLEAALRLHMERNYRELQELCEYGQSDHSYIFENLVTFMKGREDLQEKASEEALKAFMKTLVFSNMTLLTSLSGELPYNIDDLDSFSRQSIERVKAPWFNDYLASILEYGPDEKNP